MPISIVVHGGAWAIPDAIYDRTHQGVVRAAKIGFEVLKKGGSALDAVQVHNLLRSSKSKRVLSSQSRWVIVGCRVQYGD